MTNLLASMVEDAVSIVILKFRFFAAMVLLPKHVIDNSIPTACTTGKEIKYNADFVLSLDIRQRVGLILHELAHIFLGHLWRRGTRDMERWNIACDYEANHLLLQFGITLPPNALVSDKYKGMVAEEIYRLLPQNPQPQGWGQGDLQGDQESQDPTGKTATTWEREVQKAINLAHKQGTLPMELERFIVSTKIAYPNWRNITQEFLTDAARNDFTYSRANRRYAEYDIVMPTLYSKEISCIVCVNDTSGSTDEEMYDTYRANVKEILEEVRPKLVVVIAADAAVQSVHEFGPMDPIVWSDKGGGGTDFRPAFDHISKHYEPKAVIYLTDLMGTFPSQAPDYPVLWASTSTELLKHIPFGEKVYLHPYE